MRLPWISSLVIGPVLPAMSLVPARMTTAFGFRSITSGRNRISICGVVWPLIPRPTYDLFFVKKSPKRGCGQASVIESPMNTTRDSPAAGLRQRAVLLAIAAELRPVPQPGVVGEQALERRGDLGAARRRRRRPPRSRRAALPAGRTARRPTAGSIRSAARVRMRTILSVLSAKMTRPASCPGCRHPPVAADPERQHHRAAAERGHRESLPVLDVGHRHGREAERGREEREERRRASASDVAMRVRNRTGRALRTGKLPQAGCRDPRTANRDPRPAVAYAMRPCHSPSPGI